MTDQELKDLVAQLAISQAETGRALRESGEETDRRMRETDRQIKELGKQIGGLGDKCSFQEPVPKT